MQAWNCLSRLTSRASCDVLPSGVEDQERKGLHGTIIAVEENLGVPFGTIAHKDDVELVSGRCMTPSYLTDGDT